MLSTAIYFANIIGMKKRIVFAVLMTALIFVNFTYAFNSQPQANQLTVNVTVSVENEKVNTEPTTVKAQSEPESTTAPENQPKVSENRETTVKPENGNQNSQQSGETAPEDDKTVSSNSGEIIQKEDTAPQKITVTVSINCENAVNYGYDIAPYLLSNAAYTAEQGATAFDVLKALCDENGISLKYQRKTYIQGIGGLNEKDCGGSSGWTYRVNGELIKKPASSYTLQNGDVIEWRYVTNSNE